MEQRRRKPTELQKISDPNFLVEVAVGPPLADLVPQRPGTGIVVWGQYCGRETRYIWKKAHLSEDDNRIFDVEGRLMAVSHHYEKNPYESLDPLNVLPSNPLGDWESICYISGYHGMPDLKLPEQSGQNSVFLLDSPSLSRSHVSFNGSLLHSNRDHLLFKPLD